MEAFGNSVRSAAWKMGQGTKKSSLGQFFSQNCAAAGSSRVKSMPGVRLTWESLFVVLMSLPEPVEGLDERDR